MNEFDHDVMVRKNLAIQDRHRKKGGRSKKCSLPSDSLTSKELNERNGEIMVYNLNKPMKWDAFKFMPPDLQEQYLVNLLDKHCGNGKLISEMFGVSQNSLTNFCNRNNMKVFQHSGGRRSKSYDAIWQMFLDGKTSGLTADTGDEEQKDTKQPKAEPCSTPPESISPAYKMECKTSFVLDFEGRFNGEEVLRNLSRYVHDGENVRIHLSCAVVPESSEKEA